MHRHILLDTCLSLCSQQIELPFPLTVEVMIVPDPPFTAKMIVLKFIILGSWLIIRVPPHKYPSLSFFFTCFSIIVDAFFSSKYSMRYAYSGALVMYRLCFFTYSTSMAFTSVRLKRSPDIASWSNLQVILTVSPSSAVITISSGLFSVT